MTYQEILLSLSLRIIKPITALNASKPPPSHLLSLVLISPSSSADRQDRCYQIFSPFLRHWSTHQEWETRRGLCMYACVCRGRWVTWSGDGTINGELMLLLSTDITSPPSCISPRPHLPTSVIPSSLSPFIPPDTHLACLTHPSLSQSSPAPI